MDDLGDKSSPAQRGPFSTPIQGPYLKPIDTDDGVSHMFYQLHAVAAGLGMTFEQLTGVLTDVNYTSSRVGRNEFNLCLDHWQWHMVSPQWCSPVWRRFQAVRRVLGRPGADLLADWSMPARPTPDPEREAKALKTNLRLGRMTWGQMVAADGGDPERQFEEVTREHRMFGEAGVPLDGDPARVDGNGGLQDRNGGAKKPAGKPPAPLPAPPGGKGLATSK